MDLGLKVNPQTQLEGPGEFNLNFPPLPLHIIIYTSFPFFSIAPSYPSISFSPFLMVGPKSAEKLACATSSHKCLVALNL